MANVQGLRWKRWKGPGEGRILASEVMRSCVQEQPLYSQRALEMYYQSAQTGMHGQFAGYSGWWDKRLIGSALACICAFLSMFMDHGNRDPSSRDVDMKLRPVCAWKNMLDVDLFTLLQ
jgi:hypothetical protein